MDFAYTEEDEAFRAELQAWLDDNLPEFLEQGEIGDDHLDDDPSHDGAAPGVAAAAARGRLGGHQLAAASGAAARPPRCRTSSTPR